MSYLCIGGSLDGRYLKHEQSPKVYVAKTIQFDVFMANPGEALNKSILEAETYELERFQTPKQTFYFWRLNEYTVEEAFEKLLEGYKKK